jgi:anti-sigma-K factor RskA
MADHLVGGLRCEEVEDLAASFVLGALEAAEMSAVRAHLAGCPEEHPEFAELGSVVPALFEAVDLVEPPATLRDRIMAGAAADSQRAVGTQRAAELRPTAPAPLPAPERRPVVDTVPPRGRLSDLFRRPIWAGIAVAAALALVALGVWNVQLRDQVAGLTAYRNGVVAVLDQASAPGARLAVLNVPEGATGPSGLAAISAGGTNVSLVMRDLAPTTGAEVYEAWVIAGDNAPVPIGHFTVDASGTATFVTTSPSPGNVAITVALTREPGPGARTPTLPIVALGTAG